ncbi:hypothetical protein V1294_007406 [Bradyrhizobium sp. AZCC 1678]|uniref:hypothetical protein n=1 Tax=Bradyrhizobium sp. AZCC 1678 TaxID=3117030 RepID=UPI002FF29B91
MLDEAAGRARLHIMEWGHSRNLFDWGLYMVYMPSREPRLFQRATTRAVASRQERAGRTPGDRAEFPVRSGGAFDQPERQGVCALYQPADLQERCQSHVRYRDLDDLLEKIDLQVVPLAEKKRSRI